MPLFLAFLLVPVIEIGLFIQVGGLIGLWPTLAIVVITAMVGTWLVKSQGRMALQKLTGAFNDLQDPSEPLAEGAMILFAGALLLTPGFFTDAVGFALLMPPVLPVLMLPVRPPPPGDPSSRLRRGTPSQPVSRRAPALP